MKRTIALFLAAAGCAVGVHAAGDADFGKDKDLQALVLKMHQTSASDAAMPARSSSPAWENYVVAKFFYPKKDLSCDGQIDSSVSSDLPRFEDLESAIGYAQQASQKRKGWFSPPARTQAVLSQQTDEYYVGPVICIGGGGRFPTYTILPGLDPEVHVEPAIPELKALVGNGIVLKF